MGSSAGCSDDGVERRSRYVRRPLTMKLALSFTMGPSKVSLLAMMLMLPSPWNSRMLPSFMLILRMDDKRPPKRAGNPLW